MLDLLCRGSIDHWSSPLPFFSLPLPLLLPFSSCSANICVASAALCSSWFKCCARLFVFLYYYYIIWRWMFFETAPWACPWSLSRMAPRWGGIQAHHVPCRDGCRTGLGNNSFVSFGALKPKPKTQKLSNPKLKKLQNSKTQNWKHQNSKTQSLDFRI